MQIIIIEDEDAAVERLEEILLEIDETIDILAVIDSVEEAVQWFRRTGEPDLIFLDVQLSDGICFEIFSQVNVNCAVIFTTAYDEYAIRAFELNSIDYLIKPVDAKAMKKSLKKFQRLKNDRRDKTIENIDALLNHLDIAPKSYKNRFLVRHRDSYHKISCEEILVCFTEDQMVYLLTKNGKRYPVDYTLNEIEEMLNPSHTFRINRQMIVSMDAIQSISVYFNNRLKLELSVRYPEEIIVSRGRAAAFKAWLDG